MKNEQLAGGWRGARAATKNLFLFFFVRLFNGNNMMLEGVFRLSNTNFACKEALYYFIIIFGFVLVEGCSSIILIPFAPPVIKLKT